MKTFTLLVLALITISGCVAYNDQCVALVDNPNERVAFIAKGTEIFLDRPNARHANNVIGQVAADAFVWVFKDSNKVDLAIVNGGSIRAEGLCVTRNIVREGPLSNGVLHEILLFENPVNAVDLSETELFETFEHSAERLFLNSAAIASPAGSFLQVSQEVAVEIDCSKPTGSRVISLKVNNLPLARVGRPLSQVRFRVAMSSFLLGGGDGYTAIGVAAKDVARNVSAAQRFGGIDSNITAAFLKESDFNKTVEAGIKVQPRVKLTNCAVPVRPSN
jgi:5'-nucleotidase / UDP-sugar diphosphatase